MPREAVTELAPTGVLRAAINMGNFLLVTGKSPSGDPEGVSPDLAREIGARLGVPVAYVPYARPGELADAAGSGVWDIGLIGAEPQRAERIAFTAAYVEIEATYMVPPGSPIKSIAEVDRKGVRVAVSARSAYGLWLENNIKNSTLMPVAGLDAAFNKFAGEKLDVLAGMRPRPLQAIEKNPGSQKPDAKVTGVQHAARPPQANKTRAEEPGGPT